MGVLSSLNQSLQKAGEIACKFKMFVAVAIVALSGCCPRVSMVDVGPLARTQPIDCLVTAHRGALKREADGLGKFPDNSLPALAASVANGIPLVEVDVRLSDEGELFLFHDGSLSSSNSYSPSHLHGVPIARLTRAERAPVWLDASNQVAIPTLDEALTVVARSSTALQLDFKGESDTLVFAALELVVKRGMLSQVVLQIRSPERVARIKQRYPTARILARCVTFEQLQRVLTVGVELVELERWVSSEAINLAHAQRVKVLLNIATSRLDEPETWEYLRSRGIDVIMSDRAGEHVCRT
jgi:glycerophosphoryl diester phosphodiesterase